MTEILHELPRIYTDVNFQDDLFEVSNSQLNDESLDETSQKVLAAHVYDFVRKRATSDSDEHVADVHAVYEGMTAQYALLTPLGSLGREHAAPKPALTVCVPVAILGETETTVLKTVGLIRRAQQHMAQPVEIILWANAKYCADEVKGVTARKAREQYHSLRNELAVLASAGLEIQTALQVAPAEDGTISKVRSNFMDAVAIESLRRNYGYDHPVLWLDADTTFLAKNALDEIAQNLRCFNALLVHANLQFSADWGSGLPLRDLDDATKAVVVHEICRRQAARIIGLADSQDYDEEAGMAMLIGTYLRSGGINTRAPMDESSYLIEALARENHFTTRYKNLVPAEFHQRLGSDVQFMSYIDSARVGVSARRHYELAKQYGPLVLDGAATAGYDVGLYSETPVTERQIIPSSLISLQEMHELVARKDKRLFPDIRPELYAKVVDRLIDKYFNDK